MQSLLGGGNSLAPLKKLENLEQKTNPITEEVSLGVITETGTYAFDFSGYKKVRLILACSNVYDNSITVDVEDLLSSRNFYIYTGNVIAGNYCMLSRGTISKNSVTISEFYYGDGTNVANGSVHVVGLK